MQILIAGGTGFVGRYMVRRYLKEHHTITVIGRSEAHIHQVFSEPVQALSWQQLEADHSIIAKQDLIINLAGAGIADKCWSKARRKELIDSRIKPTALLASLCAHLKSSSPPLFNASAIGFYGTQKSVRNGLPSALTESATNSNTHEFAPEIVRRWEEATQIAHHAGVRVVNMRFGVVLGQHGGMLQRLKLPFLLGLGGKIGNGRQPLSWIALPDLCRAIDFLLPLPIQGPVNFVAPETVTQKQFARTLGKVLHRPTLFPTPGILLKIRYGQMAKELLLKGQHVYPEILLESGFVFQYPELKDALMYAFNRFDKTQR